MLHNYSLLLLLLPARAANLLPPPDPVREFHVSKKFAAMSSSSAISGATLNSGMLRVVLHNKRTPQQGHTHSAVRHTYTHMVGYILKTHPLLHNMLISGLSAAQTMIRV